MGNDIIEEPFQFREFEEEGGKADMSCGTKLIRTFMFACNILVWLIGMTLFALGLYLFLDGKDYEAVMDASLSSVSVVIIVIGFTIALIGFLGCCGAVKKSSIMLLLYAIFLSLIAAIQLTGGVLAFVYKDSAVEYLETGIADSLSAYGGTDATNKTYTTTLALIQEEFDCCGAYGNKDWGVNATMWIAGGNSSNVPDSCCITSSSDCGAGLASASNSTVINTEGCLTMLEDFLHTNLQTLGIVAASFVVVEILNLFFAFQLHSRYK